MPKAQSKAQARFYGAVAGGDLKKEGLSSKSAKKHLKGVKLKDLPERAKAKKKK